MSIRYNLKEASFRGATFLYNSGEMTSGRKIITFEYPKKDERGHEDQGRYLKKFSLTGYITGTGSDYFQKRDALINALEQKGSGLLVHPFYGTINVSPKLFTVQQSITELGIATFQMPFEETSPQVYPIEGINNIALIARKVAEFIIGISSVIGNNWNVSSGFPTNFENAQSLLTLLGNTFSTNTTSFVNDSDNVSVFSSALGNYNDNINSNINNPTALGYSITNLFTLVDNLGVTPRERVGIAETFYGFGNDDIEIPQNTVERIERKKNRDTVNIAVNSLALSNAYRSVVQQSFTTEEEINELEIRLNEQFNQIEKDNQIIGLDPVINTSQTTLIDKNTFDILKSIRNEVRKFFEREILNANKVSSVSINRTTLTELTYRYYENLEEIETLLNLNSFNNPSFIEGNIKMLTDGSFNTLETLELLLNPGT